MVYERHDGRGWLKVVGSGIRIGQLTLEAQRAVTEADVVFAVATDQLALAMLAECNANFVDLTRCYALEKERVEIYREMAGEVLSAVRENKKVCFVLYGHPAVFAYPSRLALEIARREGYYVELLPGISAEDSMFCDLEVDPAVHGCQIYCATVFVQEDRMFDPRSVLTIWQASVVGESRLMERGDADYYGRLCDRLESVYGPAHPVILYEASTNPFFGADIRSIPLADLRTAMVRPSCTLVVPPINYPDLVKFPLSTEPATWISWPSVIRR